MIPFVSIGMLVAALVWPRMGKSLAGVVAALSATLRDHSERMDRAYRAYCYEPDAPILGIDRHWRSEAEEVAELERMNK